MVGLESFPAMIGVILRRTSKCGWGAHVVVNHLLASDTLGHHVIFALPLLEDRQAFDAHTYIHLHAYVCCFPDWVRTHTYACV